MRIVRLLIILLALPAAWLPAQAAPKVLVTIKPVHSLVAAVMRDVGAPALLIEGGQSVHAYALKPSDARKIAEADLIFIVGGGLENFLDAPLRTLSHAKPLELALAPGVKRMPARHGGRWTHAHDHGHGHGHDGFDPHVWLDPHNAIAMTRAIASALALADPGNATAYRANAGRAVEGLRRLDGELRAGLAGVKGRGFVVFHDAYAYFEARYGLTALGAVAVAPDRPVGPRRVAELRQLIGEGGAVCLFREPQFPPKLIATLTEGQGIRVGVLDPLGAALPPGPAQYPALMRALAASLRSCLGGKKR